MKRTSFVFARVFLACIVHAAVCLGDTLNSPPELQRKETVREEKIDVSRDSLDRQLGEALIFIYQKLVSPQLNTNCQFHPSCSEYCKQAIIKYGFFKGYVMGIERLMRCNRRAREYPYPVVDTEKRGRRMLDLPEDNLIKRKGEKK